MISYVLFTVCNCKNGGTCLRDGSCKCPAPFIGKDCQMGNAFITIKQHDSNQVIYWLIGYSIMVLFRHRRSCRNPGPGYDTLLLRLIP